MQVATPDFYQLVPQAAGTAKLRYNLHDGQLKALESSARFVLVLSGTQGGKTSMGPLWLYQEIQKRGPGDYLVATPTFPLLELKLLPEFKRLFETYLKLGHYTGSPTKKFVFTPDGALRTFGYKSDQETTVFFGHAQDPDSLESATAKGAWLDEAGQKKFKLDSYQAIMRRLSIHQGRVLITTTPYVLGWLKNELHDKAKNDPSIDLIRFESIANPAFPLAEWNRARATLPAWKFNLFYRAIFTKPAGLIYDNFDETTHKIPPFTIPDDWPRFLGLDFGGVNTVGVFFAQEPGGRRYYLYREYKAGGRTAKQHKDALMAGEPGLPTTFGGAKSEGQWRQEFRSAGLPVREPPVSEVEVGLDRAYGAFAEGRINVFDTCTAYLDELLSYSRKLDQNDEPTEEIEDKSMYHHMDAMRYIMSHLERQGSSWGVKGETAG